MSPEPQLQLPGGVLLTPALVGWHGPSLAWSEGRAGVTRRTVYKALAPME